jgi:hypothetical protein
MCVQILSFQTERIISPSGFPFIDVDLAFKIEGQGPEVEALYSEAKKHSQGYSLSSAVEDIQPYLEWVNSESFWSTSATYPGLKQYWVLTEQELYHSPETDTFRLSDCIADSSVTQAAIQEIKHFQEHGHLPFKYRHTDGYVILSLILTLSRFWD